MNCRYITCRYIRSIVVINQTGFTIIYRFSIFFFLRKKKRKCLRSVRCVGCIPFSIVSREYKRKIGWKAGVVKLIGSSLDCGESFVLGMPQLSPVVNCFVEIKTKETNETVNFITSFFSNNVEVWPTLRLKNFKIFLQQSTNAL